MKRYEILPVKQNGYKVEGYFIFDNQTKSYFTDEKGNQYFTKTKKIAVEVVNALNAQ